MKYQLQLLILLLLCLAGRLDASSLYDYGLYFKSHAVPAAERSTLYLDDNQPFSVTNDFSISFQIYIRANEADYGSILHLKTDKGQLIPFSFVGHPHFFFSNFLISNGARPAIKPCRAP